MGIKENIREGIKSILANKLRTILTAMIIAIGITALVGILTAVDAIQASITDSFSNLGSNTFFISDPREQRGFSRGFKKTAFPPINYFEVTKFVKEYKGDGLCSVNANVTFSAEVKRKSKLTNPNIRVRCGDTNFLAVEGFELESGRNFSTFELQNGANVAIIGHETLKALFQEFEDPINSIISFSGNKFKVIGVLTEEGGAGGGSSADRAIIVPLETGRRIVEGSGLRYYIGIAVDDPTKIDLLMGEATGLMKAIRKDVPGSANSFDIKKRQSLAEKLAELSGMLKLAGYIFGTITLLGASIGLMNIMLVSVTERTREIGVRKALGATPKKIRYQFLIEGIVITQLGGTGGIILGIIAGNVASKIMGLETYVIPWLWIFFGFLVSMLVGLLSGYIPAHKASKLDPIESLRFE